jgi:predicted nucleotide-binding protein (sugar kinase/HSP70/actin superfamily)
MKPAESRVEFTRKMKRDYTILLPNMLPIHFELLRAIFESHGYKAVLLDNEGPDVAELGLKFVNNDTCYPALLVVGQMLSALMSGRYNVNRTALMITQTGGGCRASNYIHLLRKALKRARLGQVPVISLNLSGLEKNGGFKFTLPMMRQALAAMAYGDLMTLLRNQTSPYELAAGDSERLAGTWVSRLSGILPYGKGCSVREMEGNLNAISDDFARVPVRVTQKIKVGVVGEIYVKYAALANNHLEDFLAAQGCEVMVPGILSFLIFKVDNRLEDIRLYGGNPLKAAVIHLLMRYLAKVEGAVIGAAGRQNRFVAPAPYAHLKELVGGVIGYGTKMGEGWLLTAEMLELVDSGYGNIVCAQPFGCLPNHVVGKGMIRQVRTLREHVNIVPVDYDPGATKVNQENRIKLMLAMARETPETSGTTVSAFDPAKEAYDRRAAYEYGILGHRA